MNQSVEVPTVHPERCANILGMILVDGNQSRTVGRAILAFLLYGLFFWRIFKNNPGNRLVECGSITLIVLLAMIFISNAGNTPDWLFGALLFLLLLLCFATLFFLFQRMYRAWMRRSSK